MELLQSWAVLPRFDMEMSLVKAWEFSYQASICAAFGVFPKLLRLRILHFGLNLRWNYYNLGLFYPGSTWKMSLVKAWKACERAANELRIECIKESQLFKST